MRKYFIIEGIRKRGPYTPQELASMQISKNTIIWTFEEETETKASEITELQFIFLEKTPPANQNVQNHSGEKIEENNEELLKKYQEIKQQQEQKIIIITKKILKPIAQSKIKQQQEQEIKQQQEIKTNLKNDNEIITSLENQNHKRNSFHYDKENINKNKKQNINLSTASKAGTTIEPPNYLILNIVSTILCCFPLGIIGITKSSKIKKAFKEKEFKKAKKLSKQALNIAIINAVAGMIFWLIVGIINSPN